MSSDAPLSHYGIAQIDKLSRFLAKTKTFTNQREKDIIELLKGESSASSVLVSSNLRRALSTVIIGLRGRLAMNPEEKSVIEPSLQEISRNPDTLAITPPKTQVNASWIEKAMLPQIQQTLTSRVDMSAHRGNKVCVGVVGCWGALVLVLLSSLPSASCVPFSPMPSHPLSISLSTPMA